KKCGMWVGGFLQSFVNYPPRQKPASFTINQIVDGVVQQVTIDRLQEEFPFITGLRKILKDLVDNGAD
ncbi:MAG TPA: arylsulfatase, partial [Cyanothece sp. UBA12306]|nr:arylsulfatase [Cyanothece sp. UBA12306]